VSDQEDAAAAQAAIKAVLTRGERLLWCGRPARGLLFVRSDVLLVPFSLLWCGFAILWLSMVVKNGAPAFFYVLGAAFVCIGLFLVVGRFAFDAWLRSRTFYGVTDQRAIVMRTGAFGTVTSTNLRLLGQTTLSLRSGGRGDLILGADDLIANYRGLSAFAPSLPQPMRFLAIEGAPQVQELAQRQAELAFNSRAPA
jgi:hypothetical protein